MTVNTVPHLNFRGSAQEALGFYRSVFGGEMTVVTYEAAGNVHAEAEADQVMWGQVVAGNGFAIMAYDVPGHLPWNAGDAAFFVSVRGNDTGEISAFWAKLAVGATIVQPLAAAGWSPLYGMLKDRYGITWVLDIAVEYAPTEPV
ncbi:MAG TPA: VOC family protein [Mesorhizobium sp.]|uniref:VOC family protein n=1 Tax=Mesorhizobium sp. TaxID=1871066 RepID=UPI002DDCE657|nr:VOC family protein [Mesorhizobium sp.]HEV2502390.1 VOC family protein [Mesorhizobium sp.]